MFLTQEQFLKTNMIRKNINGLDISKTCRMGVIHLVRTQNFPKTNISYPLIRTRTCAYQELRNVSFSKILRTY